MFREHVRRQESVEPRLRSEGQKQSKLTRQPSSCHPLLRLQQTIGNRAVGRLLQAKLTISQPDDEYEREADRVAEQVMRMPDSAMRVQRQCACCKEEAEVQCQNCQRKRLLLQRKANSPAELPVAPPIVHEVLCSPGQPLDSATRDFMESRFGHDFSRVRLHTDAKAAESAQAVNALAYTVGDDVVFGAGLYAPEKPEGQDLLAHELVHTIQQETVLQVSDDASNGPEQRHDWQSSGSATTSFEEYGKMHSPYRLPILQRRTRTETIPFGVIERGLAVNVTIVITNAPESDKEDIDVFLLACRDGIRDAIRRGHYAPVKVKMQYRAGFDYDIVRDQAFEAYMKAIRAVSRTKRTEGPEEAGVHEEKTERSAVPETSLKSPMEGEEMLPPIIEVRLAGGDPPLRLRLPEAVSFIRRRLAIVKETLADMEKLAQEQPVIHRIAKGLVGGRASQPGSDIPPRIEFYLTSAEQLYGFGLYDRSVHDLQTAVYHYNEYCAEIDRYHEERVFGAEVGKLVTQLSIAILSGAAVGGAGSLKLTTGGKLLAGASAGGIIAGLEKLGQQLNETN